MAIPVYLWSFDKKKNSTKIPPTQGTVYNGELKQDFALTSLNVTFDFGQQLVAPTYNYAHIPSLRRYYFITNWVYNSGLWVAVCVVDVLASFRLDIGNSTQYVSRAYSNYDPEIIDTSYITTPENIVRQHSSISPSDFFGGAIDAANGTIVMGVIGSNAGAVGAVTYYAMSFSVFASFMSQMLGSISWANISPSEISEELQKALINPTQYIVSCMWFPVQFNGIASGTPTTVLNLGWWQFALSGWAKLMPNVTSAWVQRQNELLIPKHPQSANPRLGYMQASPYSTYMLKFLPFGVFEIDSTELCDKMYMGLLVDFNLLTGDAVLHVSAKEATGAYDFENSFLVAEGNLGVTIPMGQVSANIGNYKQAITAGLVSGAAELIEGGI